MTPTASTASTASTARVLWARELNAVLAGLDERQRVFLLLSYFGQLSHDQIAERFAIARTTASSTIATAMQQLGAALETRQPNEVGAAVRVVDVPRRWRRVFAVVSRSDLPEPS